MASYGSKETFLVQHCYVLSHIAIASPSLLSLTTKNPSGPCKDRSGLIKDPSGSCREYRSQKRSSRFLYRFIQDFAKSYKYCCGTSWDLKRSIWICLGHIVWWVKVTAAWGWEIFWGKWFTVLQEHLSETPEFPWKNKIRKKQTKTNTECLSV